MVTNVMSLGGNGVYDWLVQRVSAVVLLSWVLFLIFFLAVSEDLTLAAWQGLFAGTGMRLFTLAALLSLCAHAWIGMWTISTDYLTTRALGKAATLVRLAFQLVCLAALLWYFVWCIEILWRL